MSNPMQHQPASAAPVPELTDETTEWESVNPETEVPYVVPPEPDATTQHSDPGEPANPTQ